MSVSVEEMKDKLLTENDVLELVNRFEPLGSVPVTKEGSLSFEIDSDWSLNVDTLADTDPVGVTVTTNGSQEFQLTKEAFNHLAVNVGLPSATVKKAPYDAVESFLNRMYRNPDKELNILTVGDLASAVSPITITPFSNIRLVESTLEAIRGKYGTDCEVFADYKLSNTLTRTDIRFIIPAERRRMKDTYMNDVPSSGHDDWSAGVHLSNSLTGKSQTFVDTYLFRWWCTNGATTSNSAVGGWDRRRNVDDSTDVYAWAATAVDSALEGMESAFDRVQALSSIKVQDASSIVGEVFSQYNLPARQRNAIMDSFTQSNELTLYTLMQAITSAANEPGLAAKDSERLMRIGGVVYGDPTLTPQKARIWDAGHFAPSGSRNPFLLLNEA